MLKKSFNSLLATWLAGLLVMLPLVLTLALLAWVVSLLNRFVGPSSLIGRGFAAIGQPLAGDSPLAYLLGTALLLVAIYLLGLGVQLGLKRPLANLFDLTLRRTPLIGNLYNLADRFVGLLDKKQDADIAAMSPVWCFFGGDGAAVLALMPNPEAVELDGRAHYAIPGADRADPGGRRPALRSGGMGETGTDRHGHLHQHLCVDGHHPTAAAGRRQGAGGAARGAAAGGSIGGPACPGTGRAPTSRLCFRSGFARSFLRKPTVLFLRDSALQRCDKMPPTPLQRHAACLAPVEALC